MKQKSKYYNNHFPVDTMVKWLKYKDYHYIVWKGHCTIKELFGIKLQPKRRHRRSIAIRNLCLLSWDEKTFEELNGWCEHGVTCEQVKKHRINISCY